MGTWWGRPLLHPPLWWEPRLGSNVVQDPRIASWAVAAGLGLGRIN